MASPHLQEFLLLLAVIIAAAKAGGWLSLRFGQPAVLGEILAGVVLGPSLLNVFAWPIFRGTDLPIAVSHLANLGVIFLMFIAGIETDLARMRRVGGAAVSAGTAGVIIPLLLGAGVALVFGASSDRAVFVGLVLAATSVSITVQTLIELGRLQSKEGTALLAAAVVDDIIAIMALSVFIALRGAGGTGLGGVAQTVFQMAVYLVAAIVLGTAFLGRLVKRARRLPVSEGLLATVTVALLVYAWAAEGFGHVASITGAYIVGVLIARAGFREDVEHRLRSFAYAILVPVFFISIGLQTDARTLTTADLPFATMIIVAAVGGKIIGCGGGAMLSGFTAPEALRVGVGMISRGEVGLIVASIGVRARLLTERDFAVMVFMVLATTVVTPLLLRASFPRPRRPLTEAQAITAVMGEERDEETSARGSGDG